MVHVKFTYFTVVTFGLRTCSLYVIVSELTKELNFTDVRECDVC